jgi:CheY-like chemotaxis protein
MVCGCSGVNRRRTGTRAAAARYRARQPAFRAEAGGVCEAMRKASVRTVIVARERDRPVRILLVEDEALIALMLEDMVEDMGCAVTGLAPRIALGLAMADSGQFDVAILDVNVAGENVEPVADTLSARGVPFIFATGYGEAGVPLRHRGRPVVSKPFRTDQLEAAIHLALARGG